MPELIERGHIYIAQPPLYKVKKGKQETYVKDEGALTNYLLQMALQNVHLHVSPNSPPISGAAFETLARQYQTVFNTINRLSTRYDANALEAMIYLSEIDENLINNNNELGEWVKKLVASLQLVSLETRFEVVPAAKDATQIDILFVLRNHRHGVFSDFAFEKEFFQSAEYRSFVKLGESLRGLVQDGAYIMKDEKRHDVSNFKEAMDWLISEAKRGQSIQRYKGLGEMNPDQLWETTMNAESRSLLRVRIEDAIAADAIFTTLMGDQVEPRRDFIERHASSVSNLDI
jgi:DNA gyrase subunit B